MKVLAIALVLISSQAFAESPYLVSPDGKFLGNLNSNRYDPDSVSNPYATQAPRIYAPRY